MRIQTLERKQRRLGLAALALVTSLGLLGAAPAQADNDFVDGFEDQMGRMVAAQTFAIGQAFIGAAFFAPIAPIVPAVPVYYGVRPAYAYHAPPPYPVAKRKHWRKGHGHAKHRGRHAGYARGGRRGR